MSSQFAWAFGMQYHEHLQDGWFLAVLCMQELTYDQVEELLDWPEGHIAKGFPDIVYTKVDLNETSVAEAREIAQFSLTLEFKKLFKGA